MFGGLMKGQWDRKQKEIFLLLPNLTEEIMRVWITVNYCNFWPLSAVLYSSHKDGETHAQVRAFFP